MEALGWCDVQNWHRQWYRDKGIDSWKPEGYAGDDKCRAGSASAGRTLPEN